MRIYNSRIDRENKYECRRLDSNSRPLSRYRKRSEIDALTNSATTAGKLEVETTKQGVNLGIWCLQCHNFEEEKIKPVDIGHTIH